MNQKSDCNSCGLIRETNNVFGTSEEKTQILITDWLSETVLEVGRYDESVEEIHFSKYRDT